MKKVALMVFLAVAVFLPVMGGVANVAHAGSTLQIVNNSRENVVEIYCWEAGKGSMGPQRLGRDTLYPGESFTIRSAPVTTKRYVNVRCYFSGGRYKYWDSIDLNHISQISVTPYGE